MDSRTGTITAWRHVAVVALSLMLALVVPAGPSRAAATEWVGNAHAAARLITAVEATGSSGQLDAGLQIRLAPGWHTYWRTPGDAGVPPTIDWKSSQNLRAATVAWPAPRRLPSVGGLETQGYTTSVVLPISVALEHPGDPARLHAELDYAACKDICIPYHASLDLSLPSGLAIPGPEAPLIAAARRAVPDDFAAAGLRLDAAVVGGDRNPTLSVRLTSTGLPFRSPDLFVEGANGASPGRPDVRLARAGRDAVLRVPIGGATAATLAGTRLRLTVVDGDRAAKTEVVPVLGSLAPVAGWQVLAGMIGVSLLGGLILNLMPCVLPVLSLKILALVGLAGNDRRPARLGLLATAAGVIVSFGLLAVALIGLKQAGAEIGWGIQFQFPWFLAAMAVVTSLFAASLWDWLPIALPGAATIGSVQVHSRLADAFLVGVFATMLAASCSAPFVGTAVGFALARDPVDILAIFLAIGIGMAAPLAAAAAWPGLGAWLPRPGRWMVWLRAALGFALLGTAAWLLWVLSAVAGTRAAIIASLAIGVLLAMLAWRHLSRHRYWRGRPVTAAAAALALFAVVAPSLGSQALTAADPGAGSDAGVWTRFDPAGLHTLVSRGHIVFVNVTADWCLICKANEITVLSRRPISDLLRTSGVVAMRADWTRPDPSVTAYLQSFSRYGVPLDVVYGPGAPNGIALPELLTSGAIVDAFHRAAGSTREASR